MSEAKELTEQEKARILVKYEIRQMLFSGRTPRNVRRELGLTKEAYKRIMQ